MGAASKKEIRSKIEESVLHVLDTLEITKASKKTKKLVKDSSKKLTDALKKELKKIQKTKAKKAKKLKSVKPKKSVKAKGSKKAGESVEVLEAQVAS